LVIAVASSSVKSVRRASLSAGSLAAVAETTIAPHMRPAAVIGTATVERIPTRRTYSAISPSMPE
jgi:hypothetical protein